MDVLRSRNIQISVILARSEFSVFLIYKEKRGCHRGLRWSNVPFVEVVLQKFIQFCLFCQGKIVDLKRFWFESFLHFDLVVPRPFVGEAICSVLIEYIQVFMVFQWYLLFNREFCYELFVEFIIFFSFFPITFSLSFITLSYLSPSIPIPSNAYMYINP